MAEYNPKMAKDSIEDKLLYKYRYIEKELIDKSKPDNQKLSYIERIFTHNELFFPSPSNLNDPLECRPLYLVGDLKDKFYKEKYITYSKNMMIGAGNTENPDNLVAWLGTHTQEDAERYCKELTDAFRDELNKNYRICSFSATNNNPLLWAHYADSHQGFCLIFDVDNELFGSALEVEYQCEYPILDFIEEDEYKILRRSSLVKYSDWSYEKEYRLISGEPNFKNTLPVKNGKWIFPKEMLKGVIFGYKMSECDRELIRGFCKYYTDDSFFKEAILNDDKYILQVVDIK